MLRGAIVMRLACHIVQGEIPQIDTPIKPSTFVVDDELIVLAQACQRGQLLTNLAVLVSAVILARCNTAILSYSGTAYTAVNGKPAMHIL